MKVLLTVVLKSSSFFIDGAKRLNFANEGRNKNCLKLIRQE